LFMIDLTIRNATPLRGEAPVDIAVDSGFIIECKAGVQLSSVQELNVENRLVIPGFVDPHVHLDIALMNSWSYPGREAPFREGHEPNQRVEERRKTFTLEDIKYRAGTALEMAVRHGVTAVRAQCHVDPEVGLKHLKALREVKEQYAGRVDVQIVAFPQQGLLRHPGTIDLFREALTGGADVMGGAANLDVDIRKHIDIALQLAMEHDVDLDIHADLDISPVDNLDDLEVVYIARQVIEKGYQGRVTVGHACRLGATPPHVADQAIALMKDAELSVVSQPDLYRLGRQDTHNVRRGLTRVKELLAAGVNVTYASNNIRDAYRPMGNFDPLEEALILSYGAHMDTNQDYQTLLEMSTYHGAEALGLEQYGLEPGCRADLVVLDTPTPSAAVIGQVEKRYIFKKGILMAANQLVQSFYQGSLLRETN
jgi:cytosine deaminase